MPDDPNRLPFETPESPPVPPTPEAREPGETPREELPWGGWDVALIFIILFAALLVSSAMAVGVAMHSPLSRGLTLEQVGHDPLVVVPAQFAAYLVVLLLMYFVVRSHGERFLEGVRWRFPHARAAGLVAGGVVLAFVIQAASALLPMPKALPIEQFFRNATGAWVMAAFGVSVAPFFEELLFRGFLYPTLARRIGTVAGVVLTSAGFALLHEAQLAHAWAPLLLVFVVGLVLTIVRARTGSVAAGFLIHSAYNTTLFAMLYVSSDYFRHLERM
jgi:hypothetical protein